MAPVDIGEAAHFLTLLGSNIMGCGLILLGVACCVAPTAAAEMYGVAAAGSPPAITWVQIAGLRDAGLGIATLALFAINRPALRVFVPAILCIPLGDAALTWSAGGSAIGVATHLAGTVAVGILCVCTWLDPTLSNGSGHGKGS